MFSIREMRIEDYDKVCNLWHSIHGFGIRSIDDSRDGIDVFIKRNPSTSVVAEHKGEIVGTILCGNDGRYGYLYHVCVKEEFRKHGIGKAMVVEVMKALEREHISKIALIAFTTNDIGNTFWKQLGWTKRDDVNYYDFTLNTNNIIEFTK